MNGESQFDVVVVGGGIAGAVAACSFVDAGLRVALVDRQGRANPVFRAERISNASIEQLINWGHGDAIEKVALPLDETSTVKGAKIEERSRIVDYSLFLWQLINEIRDKLSRRENVDVIVDQPSEVTSSPARQQIRLAKSGRLLDCKLLVVATGPANSFLNLIGVKREILSKNHSSTFGFNIVPGAGCELPSPSLTVRICRDGADYMTLFPHPEGGYRANLFTYWGAGDKRRREFVKGEGNERLRKLVPKLSELIGDWRIEGKVECGSVSVTRTRRSNRPGLVLIGDACGQVCPCSGRGVTKALIDVATLRSLAIKWIEKDLSLNPETLNQYYDEPERAAHERWVYNNCLMIRNRVLSRRPTWVLRRLWYHDTPTAIRKLYWKLRAGHGAASRG